MARVMCYVSHFLFAGRKELEREDDAWILRERANDAANPKKMPRAMVKQEASQKRLLSPSPESDSDIGGIECKRMCDAPAPQEEPIVVNENVQSDVQEVERREELDAQGFAKLASSVAQVPCNQGLAYNESKESDKQAGECKIQYFTRKPPEHEKVVSAFQKALAPSESSVPPREEASSPLRDISPRDPQKQASSSSRNTRPRDASLDQREGAATPQARSSPHSGGAAADDIVQAREAEREPDREPPQVLASEEAFEGQTLPPVSESDGCSTVTGTTFQTPAGSVADSDDLQRHRDNWDGRKKRRQDREQIKLLQTHLEEVKQKQETTAAEYEELKRTQETTAAAVAKLTELHARGQQDSEILSVANTRPFTEASDAQLIRLLNEQEWNEIIPKDHHGMTILHECSKTASAIAVQAILARWPESPNFHTYVECTGSPWGRFEAQSHRPTGLSTIKRRDSKPRSYNYGITANVVRGCGPRNTRMN